MYSTRGKGGTFGPSDSSKSDAHEKTNVSVFGIDGKLITTLPRTVFLDINGDRVVRFLGQERKLRNKKGSDAIVLSIADSQKYRKQMPNANAMKEVKVSLKAIAALLRETDESAEVEKETGEDSIDAQIDKFLSEYESEAKNMKTEGFNYHSIARRIINEAEGDDVIDDITGSEDAAKSADAADDEANTPEAPTKQTEDDIDMKSFVSDVMRLIDNFESLLEVNNTILRRATNYLNKNYEKEVADAFKAELLDSYGTEIGKSKSEMEDEFQAPKAGAAGPAGAAGA